MNADADFRDWIRNNPPPSLQELVRQFGDYSKITPEAWSEYDARVVEWEFARANRLGVVRAVTDRYKHAKPVKRAPTKKRPGEPPPF
jgi:hypothetical protein